MKEIYRSDKSLLIDLKEMLSALVGEINASPKVYTISETAKLLKCKERTVKHHLYEVRDLKSFKLGREVRIREEDLQEFMKKRTALRVFDKEALS